MQRKDKQPAVPRRRGYGSGIGNGRSDAVRYGLVDAELLRGCIDSVTEAGDAIMFSRTTDGGAFAIRILSDAGNGTWYPPTAEALQHVLVEADHIARGV